MNTADDAFRDSPAEEESGSPRYTTFSQAIDAARRDAKSRARDAAPKLKEALAGAAHDITYGAAFGACFAACFARELVPSSLRDAIHRGARDGRDAAVRSAEAQAPPPMAAEVPA